MVTEGSSAENSRRGSPFVQLQVGIKVKAVLTGSSPFVPFIGSLSSVTAVIFWYTYIPVEA